MKTIFMCISICFTICYAGKTKQIPEQLKDLALKKVFTYFPLYSQKEKELIPEHMLNKITKKTIIKTQIPTLTLQLDQNPHIKIDIQNKHPQGIQHKLLNYGKTITIDGYDDVWSENYLNPCTLQVHKNNSDKVSFDVKKLPRTFQREKLIGISNSHLITSFAVAPDTINFAIGRIDGTITVFIPQVSEMPQKQDKEHNPDEKALFKFIHFKEIERQLHQHPIVALGFSHNGTQIISYDKSNTATIWDFSNPLLPAINFEHVLIEKNIATIAENEPSIACTNIPVTLDQTDAFTSEFLHSTSAYNIMLINFALLKEKIYKEEYNPIHLQTCVKLFYKDLKKSNFPKVIKNAMIQEIVQAKEEIEKAREESDTSISSLPQKGLLFIKTFLKNQNKYYQL